MRASWEAWKLIRQVRQKFSKVLKTVENWNQFVRMFEIFSFCEQFLRENIDQFYLLEMHREPLLFSFPNACLFFAGFAVTFALISQRPNRSVKGTDCRHWIARVFVAVWCTNSKKMPLPSMKSRLCTNLPCDITDVIQTPLFLLIPFRLNTRQSSKGTHSKRLDVFDNCT